MPLSSATPQPIAERFVRELLGTGLAMTGALEELIDALEERNPWPGEEPGHVLLEMTAGSIRPALATVPIEEVERATDLIASARERVLADLRLAAEISARRESMRRERRRRC